ARLRHHHERAGRPGDPRLAGRRSLAVNALLRAGLALSLATAGLAQEKAATPTTPPVGGDYRIAPCDVLDIAVFDNNDLSRTPTVQTSGAIALPLLGE